MRLNPLLILLGLLACRTDKAVLVEAETPVEFVDEDGDGYDVDEDCNDNDASIFPGATEVCDGIDNDCDEEVDEEVLSTWYADTDADGFGDSLTTMEACDGGDGWVSSGNDCDDAEPESYPGATEICDGLDNDCDEEIDEEVLDSWYADADGDGYGDPDQGVESCEEPSGYVTDDTDCDDSTPSANPGAEEVCDEIDNDCDDEIDEGVSTTFYADSDGDGFGLADTTQEACDTPTGYSVTAGDCDDSEVEVHPDAAEICDEIDNDCDGDIDEDDATDVGTWYVDGDGDGYGDAGLSSDSCEAPSGSVADDTDCDDGDADVHPGAAEVCDEIDNDCDGDVDDDDSDVTATSTWYIDYDGDGYGSDSFTFSACEPLSGYIADDSDCDDGDEDVHPAATEICDEIDNDCDGDVDGDDADLDPDTMLTWYIDADLDGYGDSSTTTEACEEPSGYVSDDTDCDDSEADISPVASELCDGIDNDCDGDIDEDDATDVSTWYADSDEDGYGDSSVTAESCEAPSGYVSDATDCDDSDGDLSPAATEICDGFDNDCDGYIDDDDASLDTTTGETWYLDADLDGYGDPALTTAACDELSGYVEDGTDCDDDDSSVSPGSSEICDGVDNDCDGDVDEAEDVLGSEADCAASSCLDILDARSSAADGDYWIDTSGGATELTCDMSTDDGGWTLVMSFPTPTSSAGVTDWNATSRVGSDFTDLSSAFKLSDSEINDLVTTGYRGFGWASQCYSGACSVDITRYWDASCVYQSNGNSTACGAAWKDVDLTSVSTCTGSPCGWHYGLTAVACGSCTEFISSHSANHIGTGVDGGSSSEHAYDGRYPEDPSLEVWVR